MEKFFVYFRWIVSTRCWNAQWLKRLLLNKHTQKKTLGGRVWFIHIRKASLNIYS